MSFKIEFSLQISIVMTGEKDETVIRNLKDQNRKAFRRNGNDSFIMAVPRFSYIL